MPKYKVNFLRATFYPQVLGEKIVRRLTVSSPSPSPLTDSPFTGRRRTPFHGDEAIQSRELNFRGSIPLNCKQRTTKPTNQQTTDKRPKPMPRWCVFLGTPVDLRDLLILAGDIELNPGPCSTVLKCDKCNGNVTQKSRFACSEEGCSSVCHIEKKCSKLGRWKKSQPWWCRIHDPTAKTITRSE